MGFLSGLFDSKTKSSSSLDAYGPAKGYMDQFIGQLGSMPGLEAYGGQYVADMNPMLSDALAAMFNNPQGQQYAEQMSGQYGSDLANLGLEQYMDQLTQMRGQGPLQFQYDQGTFDQIMNNAMPGLESAVDMNGRLTTRQLGSDLAQLRAAGGLGGNTKVGQGSALATALAQENADKFVTNAYNSAFGAANQGGMAGGQANMAGQDAYNRNMLGAGMNLAGMGFGNMAAGNAQNAANIAMMGQAGNAQQLYNQAALDGDRQQFMDAQNIPYQDTINRLNIMSNVGAQFGTQNQTQRNSPSTFSSLANLASLGMGMAGFAGGAGMLGPGMMQAMNPMGYAMQSGMAVPGYFGGSFGGGMNGGGFGMFGPSSMGGSGDFFGGPWTGTPAMPMNLNWGG